MLIKEMEKIPLTLDRDCVILLQDSKVQKRIRDRPCGESSVPKRALMNASNKSLPGNDLKCDCSERVNSHNLKGLHPISLYYMYI